MMGGRYGAIGLVAISLGACGSPTSGSGAAACNALATKDCARALACAPGLFPLFGYVTAADCVTGQADNCQRALAQPHTGYTPARVRACGDALGAMTCEEFLSQTTDPACFPRGGTIAVGGSCSDGWQCASGRCSVPYFNQCGACVAKVPLGQACTGPDCADNSVCSVSAAGYLVCTTPVGIGGACNDSAVCPFDARCDQTTHTCAKLPALGDACDPNAVLFCDPTTTSAFCDMATSRCVGPVVVVQPGGDCSSSPTVCAGGSCSFDADAGAGTCVASVPSGGSCASTDQCAFGSNCIGGICQPLVCDGTPADAGAAAFVAAGPWSRVRQGSVVDRSGRALKPIGR